MGLFSTPRRAFRRAAQRLARRAPHEVRGSLAAYEITVLKYATQQLHQQSFVGEHSPAWPSAEDFDDHDALRKDPMPSGNWLSICPRIPRIFLPAGSLYMPPIDRLPTELLCLIFIFSAHEPYERPYLNRTFVPFKITHVCKLWRAIAVDMSLLWQQFELRPCVEKGNHRELAKICAERASGLGLVVAYHELSVDEYYGSWFNDHTGLPRDIDFCDCPMDFIIEYIDLIRDLDVSIGETSILRLADEVESPVYMLERLSMTFYCDLPDPEILVNLYSGPKLVDLSWSANESGRDVPHMVECPDAPWRQLVELELLDCPLTLDMFMDILEDAPLLQRVSTQVDCQFPATVQNRRPIRHDALRDLMVKGNGPLDVVFTAYSFPALRELALCSPMCHNKPDPAGWPFWEPNLLLHVVEHAERGLERLYLSTCGTINEPVLIDCLRLPQMSTILELTIEAPQPVFTEGLISVFHPTSSGSVLMPNMRSLLLEGCTTDDGVIADMLLARRAKSDGLRWVSVGYGIRACYPRPRDREIVMQFKDRRY
ncbi:hypothetical protein GGG16DRAFT_123033 [Schizophyllum commune]